MNLALLKMTHGSSGPEMKPFQKTRKAPGISSLAMPAWAELRLETKRKDHRRWRRRGAARGRRWRWPSCGRCGRSGWVLGRLGRSEPA